MDVTEDLIELPEDCWPLATLIYEELTAGNGRCEFALVGLREAMEDCMAFLHGLPDGTTPADIDLCNFYCGDEAKKEMERLRGRTTEE
jgi:hypothetical protein